MPTGMRYSFTDGPIDKRGISDAIFMLPWEEIPELAMFGMDSARQKFNIVNPMQRDIEVIEDKMRAMESTLNGALADGVGTTVNVAAGDGVLFRAGNIIKVDSELMRVTAVATDALTVVRGVHGTTGAAHSDAAPVLISTHTVQEGADYAQGYTTLTSQWMNHTQIISESVVITGTDKVVGKYGLTVDELEYHAGKLFNNNGSAGIVARLHAQTFYHGEKEQRTASLPGAMGGFNSRLSEIPSTNKVDLSGSAVTKDDIHTVIRGIRQNNGNPDILLCNAWGLEKIAGFYADTIRTTRDETVGGHEITQVLTPHGRVSVLYSWLCPEDEIYFVDREKVGWHALRPYTVNPTVELGDREGAEVLGEYTFLMINPEGHGKISNMSTTT